jgi:hypothetical protein
MANRTWLHDIILVNDSEGGLEPGDVTLFRSAGDACRYLEPWWVEGHQGLAFTATGEKVKLGADGRCVVVQGYDDDPDGPAIVLRWLRHSAQAILETRRHKARKGKVRLGEVEADGGLPVSVEGLIAYIGFTN